MRKKTLVSFAAFLALSSLLHAGGGKNILPVTIPVAPIADPISPIPFYIGLGAMASFIDRDPCPCSNDDLADHRYGMVLRAGYDFNPYFGIEVRGLKTFGDDLFSDISHYGVYVKPQYHISDAANIYALIGYGRTTVDYDNGVLNSHNSKNGMAYGVGLEYDLSADESLGTYSRPFDGQGDQETSWGLWVDFQHLLNDEFPMHTDLNVITAGVTYDF